MVSNKIANYKRGYNQIHFYLVQKYWGHNKDKFLMAK